jgi:hypothetical protein
MSMVRRFSYPAVDFNPDSSPPSFTASSVMDHNDVRMPGKTLPHVSYISFSPAAMINK